MATAWPVIKQRLVAALPGVVTATVYDGPVLTGDNPTAYLTVGWQPSTDDLTAGTFEQTHTGPGGFFAEERGTVLLELGVSTGDPDMPSAFAQADALTAWVSADQTLGVMTPGSTSSTEFDVVQDQNSAGAVQRLLLTLSYTTRIERTP